jgi:hypothetical protein
MLTKKPITHLVIGKGKNQWFTTSPGLFRGPFKYTYKAYGKIPLKFMIKFFIPVKVNIIQYINATPWIINILVLTKSNKTYIVE